MEYHGPLVSCETVFENLRSDKWVIFDVRHNLMDPDEGPALHAESHVEGAFHAHVDHDLSSPVLDGSSGRHPLPHPKRFIQFLRERGVDKDSQVVCYDDMGGAWAGRLWWLLRHYGHKNVAVMDGGLRRWKDLGLALDASAPQPREGDFDGSPGHMPTVSAMHLETDLGSSRPEYQIVDARAAERFKGEIEPIDPVAGHIPAAINLPFIDNLGKDWLFLSPDELRARYEAMLGQDTGHVVVYCGSGVTAAHDVLAMEVAGLPTPSLYPGGWSEWCHPDSGRDVVTPSPAAQ